MPFHVFKDAKIYRLESPEETISLGKQIGSQLKPNTVLCFFGDLGVGKTTFIKGIVAGVTNCGEDEVQSPTFVYLSIYGVNGNLPVYHFDLYRLQGTEEFLEMGFEELFVAGGVCCIEWSEKIEAILPEGSLCIRMAHAQPGETETLRHLTIDIHSAETSKKAKPEK